MIQMPKPFFSLRQENGQLFCYMHTQAVPMMLECLVASYKSRATLC